MSQDGRGSCRRISGESIVGKLVKKNAHVAWIQPIILRGFYQVWVQIKPWNKIHHESCLICSLQTKHSWTFKAVCGGSWTVQKAEFKRAPKLTSKQTSLAMFLLAVSMLHPNAPSWQLEKQSRSVFCRKISIKSSTFLEPSFCYLLWSRAGLWLYARCVHTQQAAHSHPLDYSKQVVWSQPKSLCSTFCLYESWGTVGCSG